MHEAAALKATIQAMRERLRLTQDALPRCESELRGNRHRLSDTRLDCVDGREEEWAVKRCHLAL